MTEWSEMTWTAIGLIAAAAVLSLIFAFMGLGGDLVRIVHQDNADAQAMQEIRTFLPYDNTKVSGAEVLTAMIEMSDKDVPVIVCMSNLPTDKRCIIIHKSSISEDTVKANMLSLFAETGSAVGTAKDLVTSSNPVYITNRTYTTSGLINFLDEKVKAGDSTIDSDTFTSQTYVSTVVETKGGFPSAILFRLASNDAGGVVCG